jgi:hypothetical protein
MGKGKEALGCLRWLWVKLAWRKGVVAGLWLPLGRARGGRGRMGLDRGMCQERRREAGLADKGKGKRFSFL